MPSSYEKLAQAYATTAGATLYTGPGSTQTIIRHIRVVSVAATDSFRLADGADYEDNCIQWWTPVIFEDDPFEDDVFICVAAAATIKVQSSVADTNLVVTLYGVKIT